MPPAVLCCAAQVMPMTAEEEAGWRQVEMIITSSPKDSSTPQPATEEPMHDLPTSPVPAAATPLLPEAQEEPRPPAQPTLQDKALIDKQAQRSRRSPRCVCPLSLSTSSHCHSHCLMRTEQPCSLKQKPGGM